MPKSWNQMSIRLTDLCYTKTFYFQQLITEKRGGTLIYIYYNDFVPEKKYCVDVIARKAFDVKNAKLAGVKVYDYINKRKFLAYFIG